MAKLIQLNIFNEREEVEISRKDYSGFVEKFKAKKTTDDCYTPPAVYEAVKNFVNDKKKSIMITLTINKYFNDESKTEKKQVEPKNLYTRLYFCFKDFKENTKIKSVGFTIECGKYAMSGYFSRFVAYYPCSRPITYNLNIYGQSFNCRTIKEGIRHYTELFLKKINYEKE